MRPHNLIALLLTMTWSLSASAAGGVPNLLPFQGRATDSSGHPINYSAVFKFRIYPPSGNCYIYEETQTLTPNDSGIFSTNLGTTSTGPANAFNKVFNNDITTPLTDSCGSQYTPAAGDWRRLQLVVDGSAMADMQTIGASAFAINAQMLEGKSATDFVQISTNVTQANVETLTGGGDASSLHNHDSLYMRRDSNTSTSGNISTTAGSVGIGTTAPAADIDIERTAPSIRLDATNGGGGTNKIDFFGGSTQLSSIQATEGTLGMKFYSGSVEAMRIDSARNLILSGSLSVAGTVGIGKYDSTQEPGLITVLTAQGTSATGTVWMNSTTGSVRYWDGSSAKSLSSGSSTFAGDISGTASAISVDKIKGIALNFSTAPTNGQILTYDTSTLSWKPADAPATGLTSLNGLTTGVQTFANGTSGTAPAFSSSGSAHTLNIPLASGTGVTAGLISKSDYDSFNTKMPTTLNSGNIFVGNASNVATGVTLSGDATITNAGVLSLKNTGTAGTYSKVTTDAQGRVTSGASLGSSDITTALGFTPVNRAGDTMTGALILSADPSANLGAATKQYVDSAISTAGGAFIKKDGSVAFTGDQSMGGHKLTSVTDPSGAQDAATKNYADLHLVGNSIDPSMSTLVSASAGNGKVLSWDQSNTRWTVSSASAGSVTNVGLSLPSIFTVTGSPVTSTGTISASLATQNANAVFAGPTSGGAAVPTFRALTAADIPALGYASSTLNSGQVFIGNASNVATGVTLSGDATVSNAGVMALKSTGTAGTYTKVTTDAQGRVTSGSSLSSSDVTAALGFTPSSSSLASANIFVGNGSGVATAVAASGDVSLANTGAFTVGSVGGVSAANVASGANAANAASAANTASVIVVRDASKKITSGGEILTGSTSGTLTINPAATTTSYAVTMPAAQGGANTYLKNDGSGGLSWSTAGSGSVTSVDVTFPSIFSVSGGPVTTSGTIAASLANQNANLVLAGPSSGGAAAPSFRALVPGDVTLASAKMVVGNASGVGAPVSMSGDVTIDNTGATTVGSVGGASAASIASAVTANGAATSANTASTIVKRDAASKINTSGEILNGSTSGTLSLLPTATVTSYSLTFPSAQGAANTALENDGSGNLSWVSHVKKAGDTMTGLLVLSADPSANLGASTKQYVDSAVSTAGGAYIKKDGSIPFTGDQSFGGNNITNLGSLTYKGATSGTLTVSVPSTVSSYSIRLPSSQGASSTFLQNDGAGNLTWGTAGAGSVTSVGLSLPSLFSVSGSPVTGSGTLSATLATQSANQIFAGPTSGGATAPTFRALVATDIPALAYASSTLTSGQMFVGNASNLATGVTMSGDATISNTGVLALKSTGTAGTYTKVTTDAQGRVTSGTTLSSSDVTTALGFTPSTSALASANIFVGNGSGVATAVAASGDISLANTGAFTVGAVGGVSAANVASGATAANAASAANTASVIVMRDASKKITSGGEILAGSTSGTLTINPAATTTSYAVTMPAAQGGANTYLKNDGSGGLSWATAGSGSVTSVDVTFPSIFSVSGGPVTTSGTIAASLANQNANLVLAGPSSGGAATPAFRSLVPGDVTLASAKMVVGNASGVGAAVSMSGDVTMDNTGAATVGSVGGASAASIASAATVAGGATSANTASTIVKRDAASKINTSGEILNGSTSGAVSLLPPATVTSYSLTLPSAQGGAGTALENDGSGNFSWVSYVKKAGDTMTGLLVLSADPSANLGASTKQYVDSAVSTAGGAYIKKDGTVAFTGAQSLGGNGLTNVGSVSLKGSTSGTLGMSTPATVTSYSVVWPSAQGGANTYLKNDGSGGLTWSTAGSGSVTSVDVTLPSIFSVSGGPVTTSGTIAASLANQNANLVLAGPSSGGAATPSFRALVPGDMTLASAKIVVGNASSVGAPVSMSGDVTIDNTGATTVASVGGASAASIASAVTANGAATSANTASTIVKRDAASKINTSGVMYNGSTSGAVSVVPAATVTSYTLTLPTAQGGASTFLQNDGSGNLSWGSAGAGSVTSVGLSLPSLFSVSGSPVTTSGTLSATLATQSANLVFAGPSSGGATAPTFRALVATDIPALSYAPSALTSAQIFVGNGSNVATGVAMSGDATITNAGVVSLKSTGTAGTYTKVTTDAQGRVTSGSALASGDVTTALGFTPMSSSLASANIFVGNAGGAATAVAPSGDVSMTNAGAFTVASVGGVSAANVASGANAANAASSANTASVIVMRDASKKITSGGEILTGSTSGTLTVNPAATTTSYSVTMPSAQGAANTVLLNDGSGNLSWGGPFVAKSGDTMTGTLTATGFFYSSDARLKHDVQSLPDGLALIEKLRGVTFKWNKDDSDDVGLIAQEVEQVFPQLVSTNPQTGFKAVKYGNLVAPLIESTKQLQNMCVDNRQNTSALRLQVQELNRKVKDIEAENQSLRQEMAEIKRILRQKNLLND